MCSERCNKILITFYKTLSIIESNDCACLKINWAKVISFVCRNENLVIICLTLVVVLSNFYTIIWNNHGGESYLIGNLVSLPWIRYDMECIAKLIPYQLLLNLQMKLFCTDLSYFKVLLWKRGYAIRRLHLNYVQLQFKNEKVMLYVGIWKR